MMAYASYILPKKIICFFVFVLVGSVSRSFQNPICPFDFMFHTGDGVFDVGNAILSRPFGQDLPANNKPYGVSMSPGTPNGRWSDGLLDIDFGATAMGFPQLAPSLAENASFSNGVVFAVARSPVLERNFFTARGVRIPPFAASLSIQMSWFKKYLESICFTPIDCASKVGNSIFIFGDVEANDIAFPLIQGKSIEEAKKYVPYVTRAQIDATREVIQMGAKRVIICGNVPIGCYPYMLTRFSSVGFGDYDDLGCLKKINELIQVKNKDMQNAVENLKKEFPDITIYFGDFYSAFITLLKDTYSGPNKKLAKSACCGTGKPYNYNSKKFCGTPGVPVCSDPNKYIHWDGVHLTQHASNTLSLILQKGALGLLNCTTTPSLKSSI